MDSTIHFTVNGERRTVTTDPQRPLLDVLREELQLTGTKYGCGEGRCGACSVLVDGKRIFSCRTDVEAAGGKTVTTIEGLAKGDALHPVQEAFVAECASQCGYCTPGMIMAAVALLNDKPRAGDDEIVRWMNGNVCRCCNYVNILNAVKHAAGRPTKEPAGVGAAQAEGRATR
jgi:aerobic-type carbon monoxide dehydrogenase small subunit (CoxS/CutS family)